MHQGEAQVAGEQEDGKRSPGWYTIPAVCFPTEAHSPGPAGNLIEKFVSHLQAGKKEMELRALDRAGLLTGNPVSGG
jgi:hypothetical protein